MSDVLHLQSAGEATIWIFVAMRRIWFLLLIIELDEFGPHDETHTMLRNCDIKESFAGAAATIATVGRAKLQAEKWDG